MRSTFLARSPSRRRGLGRALVAFGWLTAACGSPCPCPVACADDGPTSAQPKPEAKNLDELLAVVEGEVITRRMVARDIGGRSEDETDADYERRLRGRVMSRTITRVMVKRAELFGLEVRPDVLDQQVEAAAKVDVEQAKEREEARKPGAGANITFAKLLAERGQTLAEFKALIANEILVQQYFHILTKGVPGKRPQVDLEPSPEDVLKLYAAHKEAFDQQPGVRVALFVLRPDAIYEEGKFAKYDDAVEEARRRVKTMLDEVLAGRKVDEVARSRGLKKDQYNATPEGKFLEKGPRKLRDVDLWPLDPARLRGDTNIVDGSGGSVVGLVVLEVRPPRTRTFDEVKADLYDLIRGVRMERFLSQQRIEALSTASIWPSLLGEEAEAQTRDRLKALDEDPIKRDIRLR